jgi:hypothetical protein
MMGAGRGTDYRPTRCRLLWPARLGLPAEPGRSNMTVLAHRPQRLPDQNTVCGWTGLCVDVELSTGAGCDNAAS